MRRTFTLPRSWLAVDPPVPHLLLLFFSSSSSSVQRSSSFSCFHRCVCVCVRVDVCDMSNDKNELRMKEVYEMRITVSGCMKSYVSYAEKMLKENDRVKLYGEKKAINKVVSVAEILKRKYENLYQDNELSNSNQDDDEKSEICAKLSIVLSSEKRSVV